MGLPPTARITAAIDEMTHCIVHGPAAETGIREKAVFCKGQQQVSGELAPQRSRSGIENGSVQWVMQEVP